MNPAPAPPSLGAGRALAPPWVYIARVQAVLRGKGSLDAQLAEPNPRPRRASENRASAARTTCDPAASPGGRLQHRWSSHVCDGQGVEAAMLIFVIAMSAVFVLGAVVAIKAGINTNRQKRRERLAALARGESESEISSRERRKVVKGLLTLLIVLAIGFGIRYCVAVLPES